MTDLDGINAERGEWAAGAIRHYQCCTGTDWDDAVSDLLCDLMHFCDRHRSEDGKRAISFDHELERARQNYQAETTDPDDIELDAMQARIAPEGKQEDEIIF